MPERDPSLYYIDQILHTSISFQERRLYYNQSTSKYLYADTGHYLTREDINILLRTVLLPHGTNPTNYEYGNITIQQAPLLGYFSEHAIPSNYYDFTTTIGVGTLIEPPALESPQPKWPIGTILKWKLSEKGVKEHVVMNKGDLNHPLVKVISYKENSNNEYLKEILWLGHAVPDTKEYNIKYFTESKRGDRGIFEEEYNKLNVCTTQPKIGTIVEYLGSHYSPSKKAMVIAEKKNGIVTVDFLTRMYTEDFNFKYLKISSDQRKSFLRDSRNICECTHCKAEKLITRSIKLSSEVFVCDKNCAVGIGYRKCYECSEYVENVTLISTLHGHICRGCIPHYDNCSDCGNFIKKSNMAISTLDGDNSYTCVSCLEIVKKLIHDHSYRPNFLHQKMVWENTRYLGIELEIEVPGKDVQRLKMADMIKVWLTQQQKVRDFKSKEGLIIRGKTLDKLVYMKYDGSLTNGIEIVFHPFTLKSFHKNFPLKEFMNFLKSNDVIIRENCGMHIHVSKDRLSDVQLVKGKWFFYKCEEFLRSFSDRKCFDYCKFEPYKPVNDPYRQEYGHYSVLNTGSRSAKTVEVRLFNATLDYEKFLANIQFADVFVDYIQHGVGSVFLRRENKHIIWQNFIDYAKAQNQYHVFTSWILQKRIV